MGLVRSLLIEHLRETLHGYEVRVYFREASSHVRSRSAALCWMVQLKAQDLTRDTSILGFNQILHPTIGFSFLAWDGEISLSLVKIPAGMRFF